MFDEPFRVLVVGERGVGKTRWIHSFRQSLGLGVGVDGAKNIYIPYPDPDKLHETSMLEDLKTLSKTCKYFILNPDMRKKTVSCHPNLLHNSIDKSQKYGDIILCEYPSKQILFPIEDKALRKETLAWRKQFNCVVIMAEYSDITTLRSIHHWCLVCGFSPKKTIVCVNKCDIEPACLKNDFQSRKARIMNHFVSQCPVEYISAKTGTNVQFLYKYMNRRDFREAMREPHIPAHIGPPDLLNTMYRSSVDSLTYIQPSREVSKKRYDSEDIDQWLINT